MDDSDLIKWCETDFLNIAFTKEEQKKIHYCGLGTSDVYKVFFPYNGFFHAGANAVSTPYAETKQGNIAAIIKTYWWLFEVNNLGWPQYISAAHITECAPFEVAPKGFRPVLFLNFCEMDFDSFVTKNIGTYGYDMNQTVYTR